jgi:hypothetical protein
MNDKTATVWSRLDIAYMSAICAPHADLETLKLMNDWNGWVFAFDDRKSSKQNRDSNILSKTARAASAYNSTAGKSGFR